MARDIRRRRRGRPPNQRHDPDLVECRTCGQEFDLARQDYYGPDCPSCRGGDDA